LSDAPTPGRLRIATWNINSLRLRAGLLAELIAALDPHVICLQETKVPDDLFPHDALAPYGFTHVAHRGMKGYNGVVPEERSPPSAGAAGGTWRRARPACVLRAGRRRHPRSGGKSEIRP
jgi:exodeoxyribonuclease-3